MYQTGRSAHIYIFVFKNEHVYLQVYLKNVEYGES